MIEIKHKVNCCGCTACYSVCARNAITMQPDTEGFLYPVVSLDKCNNCGLCEKVCPILQRKASTDLSSNISSLFYAVRLKHKEILKKSSSGGAFTLLSKAVLERGGIVCGVEYSDTGIVQHGFAASVEELERFRGSKYVQSNLNDIFNKIKNFLNNDKLVLFSGTPCQVDGLKRFLGKEYLTLITVDIVCHAVPSPLLFKEYIEYSSKKLGKRIVSIGMRDKKKYGWSHRFSFRYYFKDGKNLVDPIFISNWGKIFFSELLNRPSCGECKYANYNRPGDFTIADFWDDYKLCPDIYSNEGTSLLIINNNKIRYLFDDMINECDYWPITYEASIQSNLIRPTRDNRLREQFWDYYYSNGFEKTYKKYFATSRYEILKKIIKRITSVQKIF